MENEAKTAIAQQEKLHNLGSVKERVVALALDELSSVCEGSLAWLTGSGCHLVYRFIILGVAALAFLLGDGHGVIAEGNAYRRHPPGNFFEVLLTQLAK